MKKIIATTAAIIVSGTASFAAPLTYNGASEYSVEKEALSFNLGTNYGYGNFDVFANVDFSKLDTKSVTFDGAEVGVAYYLNTTVQIYGKIITDDNLDYSDTVVGASFTF